MNEINENVEYYEATVLDENSENSCGEPGLKEVGLALGGVAVVVAGAAAAFAANKMGKFDELKTKHQHKKLEKIEKKRAKLYAKIDAGSVEKESKEEE